MKMLKDLLNEGRSMPCKQQTDFFDFVIEELQKEGTILNEAIALDLMFVLLFASFETTSLALTLAVKFLSDNPSVLNKLTNEHEAVLRNRENTETGIKWREYKSMTYTFQLINETVRLANIVPEIFRKTPREIHFKGYTIPAGWAVMVCPPATSIPKNTKIPSSSIHQDGRCVNTGTEIHGASRNFMAFGGGMSFCVGTDFTKVQMAVFLHCLITKYRWDPIEGENIVRTPGLQFPDGFHVQLTEKLEWIEAGFGYIAKYEGHCDLESNLISALIERWRPKIHIFHLHCLGVHYYVGGCFITFGAFDRWIVISGVADGDWHSLCKLYLGGIPSNFNGCRIPLSWLARNFRQLSDNYSEEHVQIFSQSCILQLIGGILMPDKSRNQVHCLWFRYLASF
ncbi:Cytochrome P450 87A3 [Hibiscus syriacus]|uniref:Cytochrome P450 87A3 n=1 Tax=Hibiscus syriacus TaxID=106335 RepID=A0A6A2X895_HIBSY|nr:Cytochrome P450 87A3 [Hibiscus syriacus]